MQIILDTFFFTWIKTIVNLDVFGYKGEEKEEEEVFDKVERVVTEYEGEDPKTFK